MEQTVQERIRKRQEALEEYRRIVSYEIPAVLPDPETGKKKKRLLRFRNIFLFFLILCTAACYFYIGKQLSDSDSAYKTLQKDLAASIDTMNALKLELEDIKNAANGGREAASSEETEALTVSPASFTILYPLTAGSTILHSYGDILSQDGRDAFCPGLDLQTAADTRVTAAADGNVLFAGEEEGTGLTVRIDHGSGYISHYCFLRSIQVTSGQTVTAGEVIAMPAVTEKENSAHMEFRITFNGAYINPEDLMRING